MAGNSFGTVFRVTTWGESHGPAVGVVVDGCPAGLEITEEEVQADLDRRRPGRGPASTTRQEEDRVSILSGIFEGKTTGTPISMIVKNKDASSGVYEELRYRPRPGHADYTYLEKYGVRDHKGGGRASARETVGRVAAGAIARKILSLHGISVFGYVTALGGVVAKTPDWTLETPSLKDVSNLRRLTEESALRCPDEDAAALMMQHLDEAKSLKDSLGGVVEVIATSVPAGLGEPVFDKLDADLAKAFMSIGAVKAVEIGAGFKSCGLHGSEMNDPMKLVSETVSFSSNMAGGILGGISTGAPIACRLGVKPTPSISRPQRTVDLKSGEEVEISIKGRHDPVIPPRLVPVAEAMMALVIVDHLLRLRSARM